MRTKAMTTKDLPMPKSRVFVALYTNEVSYGEAPFVKTFIDLVPLLVHLFSSLFDRTPGGKEGSQKKCGEDVIEKGGCVTSAPLRVSGTEESLPHPPPGVNTCLTFVSFSLKIGPWD